MKQFLILAYYYAIFQNRNKRYSEIKAESVLISRIPEKKSVSVN